jgi:hypothetical protein
MSWPRTHSPSRLTSFQVSAPWPAVGGDEGEDVALQPGVLDEPVVDDRQQGCDRDQRLDDGQPDLEGLAGRRRRRDPGRHEALRRVGETADARADRIGPKAGRPFAGPIEEGGQRVGRGDELGGRRGQHDEGEADHDDEEDAIDEQDRRPASQPEATPQPGDGRLEARREGDRDEDEQEDPGRGQPQADQADDECRAEREPDAPADPLGVVTRSVHETAT